MDQAIKGIDQLWSLQTLYQVMLGSAVVAAAINVTWSVISWGVQQVIRFWNEPRRKHEFILGKAITRAEYRKLVADIEGFYCLVVRHGTDEYLSRIASDQERFEGRQQLKVRRIKVRYDNSSKEGMPLWKRLLIGLRWVPRKDAKVVFKLKLRIHRRLGTQFKCYVVSKKVDRVPAVIGMLGKCEHASDVKQSDSYHKDRVYFLLDQFFIVDTITPGIKNNFIFPE